MESNHYYDLLQTDIPFFVSDDILPRSNYGTVVKLVYTTDSKSVAFGRGGSTPPSATTFYCTTCAFVVHSDTFLYSSILKGISPSNPI